MTKSTTFYLVKRYVFRPFLRFSGYLCQDILAQFFDAWYTDVNMDKEWQIA